MDLLIISGRLRGARTLRLKQFIHRAEHGGWRVSTIPLDDFLADPGRTSGADDLAIIGGDGVVQRCLAHLPNLPVVVVPAGTGNDLCRSMGILSSGDAARALRSGRRVPIDLGTVRLDGTNESFANGVGIGLDGEVARRKARGMPYTAAVAAALWKPPHFRAVLTDESGDRSVEFLSLLVANGAYFGGGYALAPKALLNDGLLDCVQIARIGRAKFLRSITKARKGAHISDPAVSSWRTARIVIESERPLPLHVDGEVRSARRIEIEIRPKVRRFYLNE